MTAWLLVTCVSACSQKNDTETHPLGEMPPIEIERSDKTSIPPDSIVPVEPGYFRPPLDIPINLGGTFGELRPNHFHAGIDIRTNAQEGLTVRACADGFVSRILVSAYGYGNALYIDHPNGYTTVYAHLKSFVEPIASYVKARQYEAESFEVNLYPEDTLFPVTKGMKIALSGNSGRSTTPHLHFEIRETESEWVVDPLLLTDWVKDDVPPVITQLEIIPGPFATRFGEWDGYSSVYPLAKGSYRVAGDTLDIGTSRCVIGLRATDRHNGNPADNDINAIQLFVDGQQLYGWNLRKFSFDDTRNINAHTNYRCGGSKQHRLYKAPGDEMPCYTTDGTGLIAVRNKPCEVTIMVSDAHGNSSELTFWLKGLADSNVRSNPIDTLRFDSPFTTEAKGLTMIFEPNSFYDNILKADLTSQYNCGIPLRKSFQVLIVGSHVPHDLRNKVVLVRNNAHDRSRHAYVGEWTGDYFQSSSNQLGTFELGFDTTAPSITLISSGTTSIKFTITDNLSGIKDYDAYIDGQWVLPVYDAKNNRITHTFEKSLAPGSHEFKLVVTDAVGNVAEKKVRFVR